MKESRLNLCEGLSSFSLSLFLKMKDSKEKKCGHRNKESGSLPTKSAEKLFWKLSVLGLKNVC